MTRVIAKQTLTTETMSIQRRLEAIEIFLQQINNLQGDASGKLPKVVVDGLNGSPLPSGPLASNQGYLWNGSGWSIQTVNSPATGSATVAVNGTQTSVGISVTHGLGRTPNFTNATAPNLGMFFVPTGITATTFTATLYFVTQSGSNWAVYAPPAGNVTYNWICA